MLYRLSAAVTVLLLSVVSLALGLDLPMSRADRTLPIVGMLASIAAIVFVVGNLGRRRHPGTEGLDHAAQSAIRSARERIGTARAKRDAAQHRRRRGARVEQAQAVAREAAQDDERLAPEHITTEAEALFRLVSLAWDARDPGRLAELLSPDLLAEWERRLDANDAAGEHHRSHVLGDVEVELVGFAAGAGGAHTAVVLIEAEMDIGVDNRNGRRISSTTTRTSPRKVCEYWTLVMRDGPFTVHKIDARDDGDHHLAEPLVAHAA